MAGGSCLELEVLFLSESGLPAGLPLDFCCDMMHCVLATV